jgi:hypothetical protein
MSQAAVLGQALATHKLNLFMAVLMLDFMGAVAICFNRRSSHWRYPDFKIKRNRSQWIDGIVVDSMHEIKTKMNDL